MALEFSRSNRATVAPEATTYLYGSTVNASWQTGVVAPDSTDTVTPDPNGDGDSTVSGAALKGSGAFDRAGRREGMPASECKPHTRCAEKCAPGDRGRTWRPPAPTEHGGCGLHFCKTKRGKSDIGKRHSVRSQPSSLNRTPPVSSGRSRLPGGTLAQRSARQAGPTAGNGRRPIE